MYACTCVWEDGWRKVVVLAPIIWLFRPAHYDTTIDLLTPHPIHRRSWTRSAHIAYVTHSPHQPTHPAPSPVSILNHTTAASLTDSTQAIVDEEHTFVAELQHDGERIRENGKVR